MSSIINSALLNLEEKLNHNYNKISDWVNAKSLEIKKPIFLSLDVRIANFKMTHVDANLFPAGFNNLSEMGKLRLSKLLEKYFETKKQMPKQVLIYVEDITRNMRYIESINVLKNAFNHLGIEVKFGLFNIMQNRVFEDGTIFYPLEKIDGQVKIGEWVPDFILLNNDLTNNIAQYFADTQQEIQPHPDYGWHKRSKFHHFKMYNQLAEELAREFGFDKWLISNYIELQSNVNFKTFLNFDALCNSVDKILAQTKEKYKEYSINTDPYVVIKANKGTYGMGIMTARSADEVRDVNKKKRHTMHRIKGGRLNDEVVIQEGVITIEKHNDFTAESMIYLCDAEVIEFFRRFHPLQDESDNLNIPGMHFAQVEEFKFKKTACVISKLSTLACGLENYL